MDALAQADDPIDEIQVTASRRPLAATKVSSALTIVPAEQVTSEKLVTDALATQVGVFLQETTVGQGAPIIRGLKGSEVLHLVDGLRLNNAIFRNAPTQYLALVPPGSVERMEIVRGAPTSLYGSDAVGGVIQVISRLPSIDSDTTVFRQELALGLDSAELGKSLRASVDVGDRRLAGTIGVAWQESGNRRVGGGARIAPSGYESWSARAALHATPTPGRSWVADFQVTVQPETPRTDELVPGFGQDEPSSSEFFFEPNERHFVHIRHTRADDWFGADWTFDLGWQRIRDDRRNRDFGASVRRFEQNSSDLAGVSINAARDIGAASWVVGAELYHDEVSSARQRVDLSSGVSTDVGPRFPDGSSVTQGAVFANLSQSVGDRHTLSGGLRLSKFDIELPATGISPAADLSIDDISADLGWLYDIGEHWQLGTNVGYGFRAPNIFDLGTLGDRPGNRFNVPNPALTSERVMHYDLLLRRRAAYWSAEFVLYRLDYNDKIDSALTGEVTPDGRDIVQSRNLGRAEIHGIESGVRLHPPGAWTADLVVNYTRGKQHESDGSVTAGDRIPPLHGRLRVDWAFADALSVEGSFVFADAQDRLNPRDLRDPRMDPNGTAGWATLNVGLRWQPGNTWMFSAGLENVLDKRYRTHGSGIDAPGTNLYVTARARW